jgi:hypothetical protein
MLGAVLSASITPVAVNVNQSIAQDGITMTVNYLQVEEERLLVYMTTDATAPKDPYGVSSCRSPKLVKSGYGEFEPIADERGGLFVNLDLSFFSCLPAGRLIAHGERQSGSCIR